jgi:hypothetical protein
MRTVYRRLDACAPTEPWIGVVSAQGRAVRTPSPPSDAVRSADVAASRPAYATCAVTVRLFS